MDHDQESMQYLIIQKLYAELDEERESSATAAFEALSKISQLQKEIAQQKLESCQYKRMVEENARHSEGLLAFLEDLLYQKQMEINSLKFRVKEHLDKLSGIVSDGNTDHEDLLASQLSKKADAEILPSKYYDHFFEQLEEIKGKNLEHSYTNSIEDYPTFKSAALANDQSESINLSDLLDATEGCIPLSWDLPASYNPYISTTDKVCIEGNTEDVNLFTREKVHDLSDVHNGFRSDTRSSANTAASVLTQDIFEVPQYHRTVSSPYKLALLTSNHRDNNTKDDSTDSTPKNAIDYLKSDGCVNKGISCSCHVNKLQTPVNNIIATGLQSVWCQRDDSTSYLVDTRQFEVRLQNLEDKITAQSENFDIEEHAKLLREIQGKLNVMQSYICELEARKHKSKVTSMVLSLLEVIESCYHLESFNASIRTSNLHAIRSSGVSTKLQKKEAMLSFSI